MTTISLKDVKKSYGKLRVIHGVSVDIHDSEFIVVVGPSGCGKSTLLRMIAGLEDISEGEVCIDGKVVNHLEPMDRNIAMVFQNYALYPHMSVFDNIAYSLKIAKTPKSEIKQRVQETAELLQLGDYLHRKPRQLSGGQRQRVAMGRAIVRRPSVFLFDEPLSNLDAKLRVQMRLEIKRLQRKLGITSVFVTHDQVEAMTLGDKLMVLNDGRVEQFGTPVDLYQKPGSVFVAQFIGSPSMNIVPVSEGQRLPNGAVVDHMVRSPQHAGELSLGIRPEHIDIDPTSDVRLLIEMAEQLGANTLIHGVLEGSTAPLVVSMPGLHTLQSLDASIGLRFQPENCHWFDTGSGNRL